jgi:hypothetical protein
VTRNVLGALPQSVQASARRALSEIILAEDRSHAERAIEAFAADYGVKWPKAVAKVTGETERLLCFFDYPAEHWLHLCTTNPMVILGRPWRQVADQYGCDVSGVLQAAAPVVERRTGAQRVVIELMRVNGAQPVGRDDCGAIRAVS